MVSQPPTDTPFGLQANVAAGLAYILGPIGGIIMLVGGGTNKFVKWAAAQSITLGIGYIVAVVALGIVSAVLHFLALILLPISMLIGLAYLAAWLWTSIAAFQGNEVRLPIVAGITQSLFGSMI